MEGLCVRQTEIAEEIRKILVNFKKDSAGRKTAEYCQERLDRLELWWREYQSNNEKLQPYERSNNKYFVNAEFINTRDEYMLAKNLISDYYDKLLVGKTLDVPTQPEISPRAARSELQSREVSSKFDDIMHKQKVNFSAFMRAVSNTNKEAMEERWEFVDALRLIQNRWDAIDHLHWEIVGELEEEDTNYEQQYTKHEKIFNNIRKSINSKMYAAVHREKSTPTIDIPVFSDNFHQWVSFKDLFEETIHKNPALSSAQKMQHLKAKVSGEAERLIQHLNISSENYSVCWEILNHRFNNKKLIFTSHVNIFINLPNLQHQSYLAIKKLHDVTRESLHAIKNLGVDISTWDPLLVHILSQKLDNETYSEYIESLKNSRELPLLSEFMDFLEFKFTTLEASRRKLEVMPRSQQPQQPNIFPSNYHNNRKIMQPVNNNLKHTISTQPKFHTKAIHMSAVQCPICSAEHSLINCKQFVELPSATKLRLINRLRYCVNCIFDHNGNKFHSAKRCHVCSKNHHTILHNCFANNLAYNKNFTTGPSNSKPVFNGIPREPTTSTRSHAAQRDASETLLATALVKVTAADGKQQVMRALIDQGSQTSLISERAAQHLGLKRQQCKGIILGVGEKENNCKGMLNITCQSIYNSYTFNTSVLIMKNLIKNLPNQSFHKPSWPYISNVNLADPEFYNSRPIDLLLGAEIYSNIMLDGIMRSQEATQPLAQQTQLGWLLCGGSINIYCCNVTLTNIDDLQQFWKIEDISEQNEMSAKDQRCVEFYKATTKRLESGRYEVRIPMQQDLITNLGASKSTATAQFKNLEKKLNKQPKLAEQYKQFMWDYENLGHMKLATASSGKECFLPHHAVQRADSSTTKLRVVFNASARTSSGYSLNDLMYKGPNLQQDLQALILKWRQYRYAYTADIEKMYRQILVNEEDQKLQQILWREGPDQQLKSYQLSTVTYLSSGTKSAPFLAIMTLHQLAQDEENKFPIAAKSLKEEFYMDDLVSGAHTLEEGHCKIVELREILSSASFLLRKWSANDQTLLKK